MSNVLSARRDIKFFKFRLTGTVIYGKALLPKRRKSDRGENGVRRGRNAGQPRNKNFTCRVHPRRVKSILRVCTCTYVYAHVHVLSIIFEKSPLIYENCFENKCFGGLSRSFSSS